MIQFFCKKLSHLNFFTKQKKKQGLYLSNLFQSNWRLTFFSKNSKELFDCCDVDKQQVGEVLYDRKRKTKESPLGDYDE